MQTILSNNEKNPMKMILLIVPTSTDSTQHVFSLYHLYGSICGPSFCYASLLTGIRKTKSSLTEKLVWEVVDQCADSNTGSCMGQCPASCCYSANKVISKYLDKVLPNVFFS
jgi:hypothetical protein